MRVCASASNAASTMAMPAAMDSSTPSSRLIARMISTDCANTTPPTISPSELVIGDPAKITTPSANVKRRMVVTVSPASTRSINCRSIAIQQLNGAVIRSLPAFRNVHGGAVALHQRHLSLGVDKEHRRVGQVLIQLYDIAPPTRAGHNQSCSPLQRSRAPAAPLIDGVGLRVFYPKI